MSDLRLAILHGLYRVAWRLVQLRSLLLPGRGRGVKCLLTHEGRVLMVRHTYGARRTWYLPGGAARRHEPPLQAAARELEEELGLRGLLLHDLQTRDIRLERVQVRLTCLHAEVPDPALVRPDPVEIAEVAWFAPQELPTPRGREVELLLELLADRGARPSDP
ncbi:MAG TPA: NUDIX domain-containing protein [Solirubrobacteraceae bacterium]